ncbi:MAG: 3-oxoacyl-ACP reductase FabG [Clostridioides sp.]|nr:3-oxoacyl-ACP reductase FabG [Clostridioides sp.]
MNDLNVNKKLSTVLITGASRGIGADMAISFARKGYNVLANYNNSESNAINLKEVAESEGKRIMLFKADVTKRSEVEEMFNQCIKEFGSVDILINNAGVDVEGLFTDATDEEYDRVLDVNLKGAFICSQIALKHMISNKKGKIINISSIWGISGGSCEVIYSVSKAGLIGLTKALAKEVAPSNITVNAIAPGAIYTEMLEQIREEDLEVFRQETPLGRIGNVKDVTQTALFLAGEGGDFFTGQVLSPNGGVVI